MENLGTNINSKNNEIELDKKNEKRKGYGLWTLMRELESRYLLDGAHDYFIFCNMLRFGYRKHIQKYSFYNCGLIYLQRPHATLVHTLNRWKKLYNRDIKANATPIIIIKPFGPAEIVYEYSDTENGKEPPITLSTFTKPVLPGFDNVPFEYFEKMVNVLKALGVSYGERKFGGSKAGEALFLNHFTSYVYKKVKHETPFSVVINQDIISNTTKVYTLIHELAHILLGHLINSENYNILDRATKNLPLMPCRADLDIVVQETEAETVVENVARLLGYKYDANEYLSGYIKGSRKDVPVDKGLIMYVTDFIYSTFEKVPIHSNDSLDN